MDWPIFFQGVVAFAALLGPVLAYAGIRQGKSTHDIVNSRMDEFKRAMQDISDLKEKLALALGTAQGKAAAEKKEGP